jgi:hypothetical protein
LVLDTAGLPWFVIAMLWQFFFRKPDATGGAD